MPTYFAQVDTDGTVLRVIVAEAAFVATMPGTWRETFPDGRERKNYAGRGHKYDAGRNAFIPPKSHRDATFNATTCRWDYNPGLPRR